MSHPSWSPKFINYNSESISINCICSVNFIHSMYFTYVLGLLRLLPPSNLIPPSSHIPPSSLLRPSGAQFILSTSSVISTSSDQSTSSTRSLCVQSIFSISTTSAFSCKICDAHYCHRTSLIRHMHKKHDNSEYNIKCQEVTCTFACICLEKL